MSDAKTDTKGEKTLSTQEELKKLNAEKKALNEKQKALREKANEGKAERTTARKTQSEARKEIVSQKADLRDLTAKIKKSFSTGDHEAISKLADEIMEVSAELTGTVRKFGEAAKTLSEL